MALNLWEQPKLRDGDYVTTRDADTEENRASAEEQLKRQGCKSVRFTQLENGQLQAHGYLQG